MMNDIYVGMKKAHIFIKLSMMCNVISAMCENDKELEKWYNENLKPLGFNYKVNDNLTLVKFTDGIHLIRIFLIWKGVDTYENYSWWNG